MFFSRFPFRLRRIPHLASSRGQNLIELALTFPLLLVVILSIVEVGRAWNAYEGTRLAAMDGVHTASIYNNVGLGEAQIAARLQSAGISADTTNPTCAPTGGGASRGFVVSNNNGTFDVRVCSRFIPIFADLRIGFINREFTIMPAQIPIVYQNIQSTNIY
jgi:Flp pilus assembly protein TadG